ncbi:MAG TPA: PAS domain S-box protein [Gemmatimonadaceae bacterium]|nr:PAS domain S-box protein [Gemmatimonadaceae bacterium]
MPPRHTPQPRPPVARQPPRGRRGLSLVAKLPIAIGILITVILVIDTTAKYHTHLNAEINLAGSRLDEVAGQLVEGYDRSLSMHRQVVDATAANPAVRAVLLAASLSTPHPRLDSAARQALRQAATEPRTLSVELWSPAGTVLLASGNATAIHNAAGDRALRNRAAQADGAIVGPFRAASGAPVYPVITRVMSAQRVAGYVVLWRGTDQGPAARQQTTGLIGKGGRIYIGNTADSVWTDFVRSVPRPMSATSGPGAPPLDAVRIPTALGDALAIMRRVPATPWSVVVEFPMTAVTAPVHDALGDSLLIDALVLVLGIGGAWLVSAQLVARLARLTAAAESFAVPGVLPTPVDAAAGDEIARLGAAMDGMASRVAEALEARESSEAQYRGLFESVPLPLYVADLATQRFSAVNAAMVEHYGYSREEFAQLTVRDIRPREETGRLNQTLDHLADRPQHYGQWTHRTKSGALIEVEIVAHRCLFEGRPSILALINDVTARNRAIAALSRSEGRNRALIREAPYGIATSSLDGEVIDVNPALTRMLGHESAATLVGTSARDLYVDPSVRATMVDELRRTGQAHHDAMELKRRDGRTITVRYKARLVGANAGSDGYIEAFLEDVTERQRLEEQFHQAQRMEAIGQLAGGIAHDFNNLLTVILNTVELMLDDGSEQAAHADELRDVYRSARRGADLTRQLLAFSRRQVLTIRPLGVNHLVSDLEGLLHRLLGDDVHLSIALTPDHDVVRADPTQLEQVLFNLAANARDAMPHGGELLIEVSTRTVDVDDEHSHVLMAPGQYVQIAVSDTGEGMSPEVRERAFEPFFTTKGREKGTGLGLATVYGIVKQLDGYVWVYSEVGRGTTFRICLPRMEATPAPRAVESGRHVQTDGTETVLIAEDEDAIRSLLERVLTSHGYAVLAEASGEAALERARNHDGPIQLLVTDVVMAGISGPELATQLATLHPETVPLFLSGYTDEAVLRFGVAAGKVAFLQKPFTHQDFLTRVRDLLDAQAATT